MAAGATYEPIATVTLGASASVIELTSIPSTYTDLVLIANLQNTVASAEFIRVNGDTGSNYSYTRLYSYGTGASTGSNRGTNQTSIDWAPVAVSLPQSGDYWPFGIIQINNYANTTTYKTIITKWGDTNGEIDVTVGNWRSTSAITSISIFCSGGNVRVGSNMTLYGITAA